MPSTGSKKEAFREKIRDKGLRATAPRVAVLRLLKEAKKPLSQRDVATHLGTDDWDQSTLYRNLTDLVEVNLARVASRIGGIVRYQYVGESEDLHHHPHFACRVCGQVECVPPEILQTLQDPKWSKAFKDNELEITGKCASCRRRT